MTHIIELPKIVTTLVVTAILGALSWYVSTQVMDNRLKNVEQHTQTSKELQASVNKLIVELSHTNTAVLKNTADNAKFTKAHNELREESIVGYMGLKSIATIQTSLVKSVSSLNSSVIELKTIMRVREGIASSTPTYPDTPHTN